MELCGLYTVHRQERSADSFSYPVHIHNSHEILMVTKGRCGIVIGDTEYELEANDAALIFENETHGLLIRSAPIEFFAVQFITAADRGSGLDEQMQKLHEKCKNESGAVFKLNDGICPVFVSCMRRICDERSETDIRMYFSYIKAMTYELLYSATRKSGVEKNKTRQIDDKAELLNAVTDYIGANLNMITDLSFIEKVFHYSNSHVNRIFREYLCVSVWQYITAKKLDLAYNLIRGGSSARTAAAKCGYNDYSVFYRSFLKHFGYSPSALKSETAKKDGPETAL
ncbi:MAG: helix-turn-helix transcriptional regulator [Clostridia bacterium]|nr:helix-turn-helix transcriptional regulator [Clostridia bacterium]